VAELTQLDLERLELECDEARRRFFDALAQAPSVKQAYGQLQQAEQAALD
jgi:hypothetical protein